jgi:hypothetical protein
VENSLRRIPMSANAGDVVGVVSSTR